MHWVDDWLWNVQGPVPPLVAELVLKDGRSFYLHSAVGRNHETRTGVLRVWDLRALADDDIEELKTALNDTTERQLRGNATELEPKLDYANLYLHLDDVAYCIEWHDRSWPIEEPPVVGFDKPSPDDDESE